MAKLSPHIGFLANSDGDLRLTVESDDANIETTWTGCILPNVTPSQEQNTTEENEDKPPFFYAVVQTKSLLKFLTSHVVSDTTIACKFLPRYIPQ